MTLKEQIAVMVAADEGEEIQAKDIAGTIWADCPAPSWNWRCTIYRVKPREPRRIWVNTYGSALGSYYYSSKHGADEAAESTRIDCVEFVEVLKP